MNASDFIAKWKRVQLSERSASQQHFLDLCDLLGHPKPASSDPEGEAFTFERGASKQDGGDGWADVWKRGFFGWEYKGKHKDLESAYRQLLQYREALENPPLLVACDMDRIAIHTNFTNTRTVVHTINTEDLAEPESLEILRAVFFDPDRLKPGRISALITREAARNLGELARKLRERGLEPRKVAQFLDRMLFCLFAEDIALLPDRIASRMLENARQNPQRFPALAQGLFSAMANGGVYGPYPVHHFNGNLFESVETLPLKSDEIDRLYQASRLDWSAVDPRSSERSLSEAWTLTSARS